jgi:4'-phosphopantetheinyl transferase
MTTRSDSGRCIVWLATPPADAASLVALLDPIERSRRERYRNPADRHRFTVGAVVLRRAVARHLSIADPAAVHVDRTCPDCGRPHGRPRIDRAGVHVSVSHSGHRVAVAVTAAGDVGVDVEQVRAGYEELLEAACAPEERPQVADAHDFARLWTRKEAVLKATGAGLRIAPSDVVVAGPRDEPSLLALAGATPPACRLHDLDVGPDHAGAVAVLTDAAVELEVRDAAELEPR